MHWVDWSIIGLYVLFVTAVGFAFIRKASGSVADYFVAGRNLPWWLAGTSLIATSFAADTPLAITGIVADKGVAGNWLWWNQVIAWVLAVVFFARLWRRSGVITDAEFIELRYGGKPGAFLRGFRAFYMSVIFSTYTLAWVMLAMQKIVSATMDQPGWIPQIEQSVGSMLGVAPESVNAWKWIVLLALFFVATAYTALSGFWGIVVTDLVQFVIAMVASALFAFYAVDAVGGMAALKSKLIEHFGAEKGAGVLDFMPALDSPWMPLTTFAVYLSVLWWGDCNGFAAQRLFSTRSEKDSVLSAIWYSIAHFALRPWPWIVVALVTLVYYPELDDKEAGYPMLMMEILPIGLRGVMVASLLAAFMSTVDTHLNWNASYFVNDIYRRFMKPNATEKQCIRMSRLSTVGFAALAIVLAYFMTSVKDAWVLLFNLQAGIGMVLMLRWFWWRINAWSEVSAMISSLVVTTALAQYTDWDAAARIVATVGICTPIWVLVTLLTSPVDRTTLESFYRRIRPDRTLWGPVAQRCSEIASEDKIVQSLWSWVAGAVALYAGMFAIGKCILQEYAYFAVATGVCVAALLVIRSLAHRRGRSMFAIE